MNRYQRMFERLTQRGEGAFVPFTVIGDPDPPMSLEILRTLVTSGADALELGIPFSDPIADGPTVQAANVRALGSGTKPAHAWSVISALRNEFDAIPIGLLVYANLVEAPGRATFYRRAKEAGVDSVLVADVPAAEAEPLRRGCASGRHFASTDRYALSHAAPVGTDCRPVEGIHLCGDARGRHRCPAGPRSGVRAAAHPPKGVERSSSHAWLRNFTAQTGARGNGDGRRRRHFGIGGGRHSGTVRRRTRATERGVGRVCGTDEGRDPTIKK